MSIFNRIPSAPKPESELALRAANGARSEPPAFTESPSHRNQQAPALTESPAHQNQRSELALRAANGARSEPRLLPGPIRTNVSEKRIGPASWPVARPSVLRYAKRSAKGSNGGSRRFAASSYSAVRQNSGITLFQRCGRRHRPTPAQCRHLRSASDRWRTRKSARHHRQQAAPRRPEEPQP